MANHQIIRQKIAESGSRFVTVGIVKKDGTIRYLTFNPLHFGEVKGTGHAIKDEAAKLNIVRCMDIKKGWRSFDCRRTFSIKVNGQITELPLEE